MIAGITKNEVSMYVQILQTDAMHNSDQSGLEFYKVIAGIFHSVHSDSSRIDLVGEYLKKLNDYNEIKWAIMDSLGDLLFYCSTYFMAKGYAEDTINKTNFFFYDLTHTGMGGEGK